MGGASDIYARLLRERIIFLKDEIDDEVAALVTAQLLQLEKESPSRDVRIYVNSPGGSVTASLAIHDTMKRVKCDVATYAIGQAAGTALLLLAAGTRGKRFSLPHSRLHFAEIWTDAVTSTKDPSTRADEVVRLKKAVYELYARYTGQPCSKIEAMHDTPTFLGADQGVALGLVDEVLPELP
jgi:ATP-dependent Clp protease, protease subunit